MKSKIAFSKTLEITQNSIKFCWNRVLLMLIKEGNCAQIPMILCHSIIVFGVRPLVRVNKQ